MPTRYPIPAKTVRTERIVKRSRFIATAGYADSVETARHFIQHIRDEMPDATHHVYAFRVGYGSSVVEGLSDDGEPAGTSGKPTMAVLRGADVGDAVIVITRYYGGTKLGTGGLVRAYGGAAQDVLHLLPVMEKVARIRVEATVSYQAYELFKRLLTEYDVRIVNENFATYVTIQADVPDDCSTVFSQRAREFTVGNVAPSLL